MATLSTTAWVLHELGLAASFGTSLFGLIALNPAIAEIHSQRERGKVTHVAWDRSRRVNVASLALVAGTWLASRTRQEEREVARASPSLALTRDLLVGGALCGGAVALVVGRMLDKETALSNQPLGAGSRPTAETRARVASLQRLTDGLVRLNLVMNAAALAATTVLAVHAGQSSRWSVARRRR